jgi:DNA-binding PadR family transcriptional regulator
VANLLALTLLAQLTERPMYPYEMASVLRERGKDQAIKINWGSLYTVVQNLEKNEFVEAVAVERVGRQPERTTYRITPAGMAELKDWLRELLGEPEREYPRFAAALSDAGALPPAEVIALLRERVAALRENARQARELLGLLMQKVPRIFLVETEYQLAMQEAEADWIRRLIGELDTGAFAGLGFWRALHEAGGLDGSGTFPELPDDVEIPEQIAAFINERQRDEEGRQET